jgi:putative Holliday junction resolvase
MRALGVDYGRSRIGLALSDPTLLLASPFAVLENKGVKTIAEIMEIIKKNDVGVVVVGVALHMDGGESEISLVSREFGNEFVKSGVTVEYIDERWTTKIATNAIREQFSNKKRGEKRNQRNYVANSVDKVSASVILQSYLDKRRVQFV